MKCSKAIISILLSFLIIMSLFGIVPINVSAAECDIAEESGGTTGSCTWKLDGTELTISGNGKMGNIDNPYYLPWGSTITKVVVSDGVTSIGDLAFYGCQNLASVDIADSVTSIGDSAFYNCVKLTSVDFPASLKTIGSSAFSWCTGLLSADIPDSVTTIKGSAFYGCTELADVTVRGSETIIENKAFSNTAWYNDQPDGVIYINQIAYGLKGNSSKEIVIKDGTRIINYALFAGNRELKSVSIPDSVTTLGENAFMNCTGLTDITLSGSITSIPRMAFYNCNSLEEIIIPDSVTNIGESAFAYCGKLANIDFRGLVKNVGENAFLYTAWYNNQPDGVVYVGKAVIGLKNSTWDDIEEVEIKDGTLSIAEKAFKDRNSVKTIMIPDSVTSIGYGALDDTAWYDNQPDGLVYAGKVAYKVKGNSEDVVIINSGTVSVAESAFKNCTSLTSVTIPDSVKAIDDTAFYGCTNLKNVTIPYSVTSIGNMAFGYDFEETVHWHVNIQDFTISGYTGSEAERYAKENNITFISLGEMPRPKTGDADGDGEITPMDVSEVQYYLATRSTHADEKSLMFADVDGNGNLEITDVTYIQRYLVGMDIPFEIG